MKTKSIFAFDSYKLFMSHMLAGEGRHGQLTRAAEHLSCQRSYLSRVISEGLHITPDHAFNLARFWKLTPDEREYFQTLVEHDRAGDSQYRAHLKSRLSEQKRKNESIAERTQRSTLSIDNLLANYFSTWIWSAIHFLTSIPEYQNLEALSDRLGLRKESISLYLQQLEAQGLIENNKDRWIYKAGAFHVPKNSPLVTLHHQNWRWRAIADAQEFNNSGVHFTGVLTLSKKDLEKVKELLLNFIEEANYVAGPSTPEEAVVLVCDLFKV